MNKTLQSYRSWSRIKHGPAWRYQSAREICHHLWRSRGVDPLTLDAARYLRLVGLGGTYASAASTAFPSVARAFALQREQSVVDEIRVMLLGNLDSNEIVSRSGLPIEDISWWKAIFFDVDLTKDRVGWHIDKIVIPELEAGNFRLASRLHFARCMGASAARRLLDGPEKISDDPREFATYIRREAQIAAAALFLLPIASRGEMERHQKLALQMGLVERQLELAEQKLADRRAKNERSDNLANRRARHATGKAKAARAVERRKEMARAEKQALDRQLESWHR
jgi:hypothetical protein